MKQILSNGASVLMPIIMSGTSKISATILDGQMLIATLDAESFNGKSELRLDSVLATLAKDTINHPEGSFFYEYGSHNIVATVNSSTYRLRRSVRTPKIICTGMPVITKYDGFELMLSVWNRRGLIHGDINGMQWISDQDFDYYGIQTGVVSVIIEDDNEGLAELDDEVYSESIRIQKKTTPANPFYLRWLNEYGGWDYWMFSCRQKISNKLTANEYYEPYDSDGAKVSFRKEAQRVVEVSSGMADRQTLEVLSYMPQSPDIRLYKKDTQEWVPIQVENGDTEIMSDQSTGELLFSFVVPTI